MTAKANKIPAHTKDLAAENLARLAELFPNVVTETTDINGHIVRGIDADALRAEVGAVMQGADERYQFTWPDKRAAIAAANSPTTMTLRPIVDESVDFDSTENIYIKGDNLEALKILRETYLHKVKMIYIDPPYNTGNDFVYQDNFAVDPDEYRENSGQFDENGGRLVANLETNGRFHTDWLNMIYPRLRLARDLLADDGVIFISIDDNEVHNLRKICDEVFGAHNFVAQVVWQKRTSPDARLNLGAAHDYITVFAKELASLKSSLNKLDFSDERKNEYQNLDGDSRGPWASVDITGQTGHATSSQFYTIKTPSGTEYKPPIGRCWALSQDTFNQLVADNRIWFGSDGSSRPRQKKFLSEMSGTNSWTWWSNTEVGHNQEASKELKYILGSADIFTNPKPTKLIKRILQLATKKDSVLVDFFSGSATTAHAVMQLNAEDGGHRKFILVQIPEPCPEDSEASRSGYKTICDIGIERIRRAGKKIREENPLEKDLDTGFRVFAVDTSNMRDVRLTADELLDEAAAAQTKAAQKELYDKITDNIKDDRTPMDLLIQSMLTFGVPLSTRIETREIDGHEVFIVDPENNALIACFDENITAETVTEIARLAPYHFVTRDSSMASDSVAVNFEQILKAHAPEGKKEWIDWRVI